MVPRQSYLPLCVSHVLDYFQEYVVPLPGIENNSLSSVWFDYNGIPIQWQMPVGVLFDWHNNSSDAIEFPWDLTIHFQDFPSSKILPWPPIENNSSLVEAHYMHTLKQAFYTKFKSVKLIMEMPQALQSQLWTGVSQSKTLLTAF